MAVPRKVFIVVLDDWNANVGTDANKQWTGTVGKSGFGKTNDRGLRFLEFSQRHRFTLANRGGSKLVWCGHVARHHTLPMTRFLGGWSTRRWPKEELTYECEKVYWPSLQDLLTIAPNQACVVGPVSCLLSMCSPSDRYQSRTNN